MQLMAHLQEKLLAITCPENCAVSENISLLLLSDSHKIFNRFNYQSQTGF
jgi:hypothetical protein